MPIVAHVDYTQIIGGLDYNRLGQSVVTSSQTSWYVDGAGGNDANSGFTIDAPKKTISAAMDGAPADAIIWLKRNSRFRETVNTPRSLHFKAYGGGERPIVDGSKPLLSSSFVVYDSGSYPNVYQVTVDYNALFGAGMSLIYSQNFFQFFEGQPGHDTRFTFANGHLSNVFGWTNDNTDDATRLAYVRDNPGSFHVRTANSGTVTLASSGSVFQFYVHLPDNGDPRTNGKEYSVSNPSQNSWVQDNGGSVEDVWVTRTGHRNGFHLVDVTARRVRCDQYPVHGTMMNSSVMEDCESYGIYGTGACFHGFRATNPGGCDKGNIYRRCYAQDGAWGFYSHGNGGAVPSPQLFNSIEDCVTSHVITPYDLPSVSGTYVKGGENFNCISIVGNAVYYKDTFWVIDSAIAGNDSVFSFVGETTLENCIVMGGRKGFRLCSNTSTINLVNTSVVVKNDVIFSSPSLAVSASSSIWPVTGVSTASNSYLPGIALNASGSNPLVPSVMNCYSPKRLFTLPRTPISGGWNSSTTPTATWKFTSGSNDIEFFRQSGGTTPTIGSNSLIRLTNYDGSGSDYIGKFVSFTNNFYGANRDRIIVTSGTVPSLTVDATGRTAFEQLRSIVRVWPKTATSLNGRCDYTFPGLTNIITITGSADDLALLKIGTPVLLYHDGQRAQIDAGVYWIQSSSADRYTLDRAVVAPIPGFPETGVNYRQRDNSNWGDGSWFRYQRTPRFEVRLPAATIARLSFAITGSAGTVVAPTNQDLFPLDNQLMTQATSNSVVRLNEPPGFVGDVTFEPQTVPEATADATINGEFYVHDLEVVLTRGQDGLERVSEKSYLYGRRVGSTL